MPSVTSEAFLRPSAPGIRASPELPDLKGLNLGPNPSPVTVSSAPAVQVTRHVRVLSRDSVLNHLKEITGVEDPTVLNQALEASCNESGTYNLTQAVNILVDEHAVRYNQQARAPVPKNNGATKRLRAEEETGVIDLTNDNSEKEEIQKAIALSLQDQQHGVLGGQVTVEEQDISMYMVLEQSLAESKAGTKRKRAEVWQDPLNPHERKRQAGRPVGLKNVGNTCWFSAVIQSLFHLPMFRRLVLNFVQPKRWDDNFTNANPSERRNMLFMQELRNLFALMVGTQRKYVDPSKAVDILKEAFQLGSSDSQQDVSEFTHKLLEWLEDAFKSDCSRPTSPTHISLDELSEIESPSMKEGSCLPTVQQRNPMLDLFYGQFRSEGLNDGHIFSNEETFGQYPLQVNGFNNIHEGLEAATAQEIESNSAEPLTKSGQEHWFTQLPPVLLFELSRFQFNQQIGRPEKIHNHFDFPEIIYMDRYMEINKNITKMKRDAVRKLKERKDELRRRLERYLNFGSGPKRVPLQDVLQYTLEFVGNKELVPTHSADVEMASPRSNSSSTIADSSCTSPIKTAASDVAVTSITPTSCSLQRLDTLPSVENDNPISGLPRQSPIPRHVSEVELQVLQSCLRRWRTEVETDVKDLQDSIAAVELSISSMYNESSLQKVPYRLHAVLVHEGQAASGHYWAYVYNHKGCMWMKFNDITVTEACWEELQKESVGGYHNASAYCLMYIDNNRQDLVKGVGGELPSDSCIEQLPGDLLNLVMEDNRLFQVELEKWDLEQQQQQLSAQQTHSLINNAVAKVGTWDESMAENWDDEEMPINTKVPKDDDEQLLEDDPEDTSPQVSNLVLEHAALAQKWTFEAIARVLDILSTKGPDAALTEAIRFELDRLKQVASMQDVVSDPRVQHMVVYLVSNHVPIKPLIMLVLLEQFAYGGLLDDNGCRLQKVALSRLKHHLHTKLSQDEERQWHEHFSVFRKTVALFTTGLELFHKESYTEALPYLVNGCALNDSLQCDDDHHRGLDPRLLAYYRRRCLLCLNDKALTLFDSEDVMEAEEALQLMNDFVVPCMNSLSTGRCDGDDSAAAEEIRSKWCSKLGEEITSQKREQLPEFLGRLLDPGAEIKLQKTVPLLHSPHDLSKRLHAAMSLAQVTGSLEAALHSR